MAMAGVDGVKIYQNSVERPCLTANRTAGQQDGNAGRSAVTQHANALKYEGIWQEEVLSCFVNNAMPQRAICPRFSSFADFAVYAALLYNVSPSAPYVSWLW